MKKMEKSKLKGSKAAKKMVNAMGFDPEILNQLDLTADDMAAMVYTESVISDIACDFIAKRVKHPQMMQAVMTMVVVSFSRKLCEKYGLHTMSRVEVLNTIGEDLILMAKSMSEKPDEDSDTDEEDE